MTWCPRVFNPRAIARNGWRSPESTEDRQHDPVSARSRHSESAAPSPETIAFPKPSDSSSRPDPGGELWPAAVLRISASRGRPDRRVTRGHFDYSSGSLAFLSSSKAVSPAPRCRKLTRGSSPLRNRTGRVEATEQVFCQLLEGFSAVVEHA